MSVSDVARDTQPQAVALLLAGEPYMGFENVLRALLRHARPLVVNVQHQRLLAILDVQGALAILQGVVQQVADAAL